MLSHLKVPKNFMSFCCCLIRNNYRLLETSKPMFFITKFPSQVRSHHGFQSNFLILEKKFPKLIICRYKSKGKKRRSKYNAADEDDEDDEEYQDEDPEEDAVIKGSGIEVKTHSLQSLRVDLILKTVLGYNRKQVEELFYENNLRVNGKILYKKSASAKVGDTIDAIKGVSSENPNFLKVGRVEIISIKPDNEKEKLLVKVRKYKSVIIDNYPDGDPWGSQERPF